MNSFQIKGEGRKLIRSSPNPSAYCLEPSRCSSIPSQVGFPGKWTLRGRLAGGRFLRECSRDLPEEWEGAGLGRGRSQALVQSPWNASPEQVGSSENGVILRSSPNELRELGLYTPTWICHWTRAKPAGRWGLEGSIYLQPKLILKWYHHVPVAFPKAGVIGIYLGGGGEVGTHNIASITRTN